MKKSMYVAALMVALCSCSSDEAGNDSPGSNEIRVGAKVYAAVPTKAPVVTGDRFAVAITAFESRFYPTNWTMAPAWQNSLSLVASPEPGAFIPLDQSKSYPASGDNVFMAAWYPNLPSVNGVVTFEKTGEEDVMWGGVVSGSKDSPITSAFTFGHALTQLNFNVQATEEFMKVNAGKAISKIEIIGGKYPKSMLIADGLITYEPTITIPFVPGLSKYALTTMLEPVGNPLMIGAMDALKIRVFYTDGKDSGEIPIINASELAKKTPLAAKAGYAHSISLVFQGTNEVVIMATGFVSEWRTGASGTGSIK